MRITLDLPEALVVEARTALSLKSTTETIIVALREVVRRRRISALKDLLGRVRVDADLAESRRRPDRLRVTRD